MQLYKVFITDTFSKELAKHAPSGQAPRLEKKILDEVVPRLKQEPHFGSNIKKLHGYVPEMWRYRIRPFRIFFCIDESEHTVILTAFRARKDAYR